MDKYPNSYSLNREIVTHFQSTEYRVQGTDMDDFVSILYTKSLIIIILLIFYPIFLKTLTVKRINN